MSNYFLNRELSWISFNKRVLEEAFNDSNPLLERIKFLSISGSNLDEFFMVRVSGLKGQIDENINLPSITICHLKSLKKVLLEAKKLKQQQNKCWVSITAELKNHNIEIINFDVLSAREKTWLKVFKRYISSINSSCCRSCSPFSFCTQPWTKYSFEA